METREVTGHPSIEVVVVASPTGEVEVVVGVEARTIEVEVEAEEAGEAEVVVAVAGRIRVVEVTRTPPEPEDMIARWPRWVLPRCLGPGGDHVTMPRCDFNDETINFMRSRVADGVLNVHLADVQARTSSCRNGRAQKLRTAALVFKHLER